MAAVSVLPSDAELAAMASLADMVAWVGIPDQAWVAMSGALGIVPDFRILALIPISAMTQAARLVQVPFASGGQRELSAVETVQ
eukprot:69542-Amphidinium_carterae.1